MGDKELLSEHGINIMKMLNEAIERLRTRGFAHRNLTPDNILISGDFKGLQLIGFNLSHHKDRHVDNQPIGTAPYWHNKYRHWSVTCHCWDQMAFGVICFEMMIPLGWWGSMKSSTSMQFLMRDSGRFHPFT
jgi:serine/threonine protein kinase